MQRPDARFVVEPGLRDLDECVEMRGGPVGEFVADGRGGDATGLAQEQRAAQLAFQGAYLAGDGGLGESEQRGGPGEGAGPVHGDECAQQGQVHAELPARPCGGSRPGDGAAIPTINKSIGRCRYCDWTLTQSQLA